MGDEVIIRDGRIKDSRELLPLWDEFMAYHRRISEMDGETVESAGENWVKYFQTHVRSRVRKAIVAECDGKIAGFLLGKIEKRPPIFVTPLQAYVDSIAVRENKRYQGIGAMMLDAFEKWAREKKMPYIMLQVVVENTPAIHLYEKVGFKTMVLSQRKLLS